MLISFLLQKLWVIQFYQVLYGNSWEFEISLSEIVQICQE